MAQCPYCATPGAYHGLSTVECVNSRCKAYVPTAPALLPFPDSLPKTWREAACICSACGFRGLALAETFGSPGQYSLSVLLDPRQDQGCADPRCTRHTPQATKLWFGYTCRMYILADLTGYRAAPAWPEPFFVALYTTSYTGLRGSKLRLQARGHSNYWDFEF